MYISELQKHSSIGLPHDRGAAFFNIKNSTTKSQAECGYRKSMLTYLINWQPSESLNCNIFLI